MKLIIATIKLMLACMILVLPGFSTAAPTHTFVSGTAIKALEMNENFNDLDTRLIANDSRLTAIESAAPNFCCYFPDFSPIGSPKNAVVLEAPDGAGGNIYVVRGGFFTNSEAININGSPDTTPGEGIWQSVFAQTDSIGDVTFVSRYRESPDSTFDYFNSNSYTAQIDEVEFDIAFLPATLEPIVGSDVDYRETFTCGDDGVGAVLVCHAIDRSNIDDSFFGNYDWARIQSVYSGSYTINGLTFNNVRFESYTSLNRFRIRANGIGTIFQDNDGSSGPQQVIYYQVNGQSGGSLVGTPFEPGGDLFQLFFVPI